MPLMLHTPAHVHTHTHTHTQVGPDSEEDGMGFKVDALSVVMGSLVFIAVILVAHVGGKYLS